MSNLSNAQILEIIASLRTLTNTLEASLGPVKAEAAAAVSYTHLTLPTNREV